MIGVRGAEPLLRKSKPALIAPTRPGAPKKNPCMTTSHPACSHRNSVSAFRWLE